MATFQLFQSSGQHWYRQHADNREIVQSSEGYTAKASCENGIRAVQANCQPHRFESFFTACENGFNHVAANGESSAVTRSTPPRRPAPGPAGR